jgi:hypothetical protein
MPLDAFRKKTLSAALAPARQRGASAFTTHTGAKSMLALAGAFGWLKGAFHNGGCAKDAGRAYVRKLGRLVN